jgi:hypothetical protein
MKPAPPFRKERVGLRANEPARGRFVGGPISVWLVFLLVWEPFALRAGETNSPPSEYQLKAAFLYNFGKFVEWPPEAFVTTNAPFTFGIMGENPFDDYLEQIVRNKNINGHPFEVKKFRNIAEAKTCHILFVCSSERRRMSDILRATRGLSILTVSELDRFAQAGGMIQFVIEGNKVRFEINDQAAREANLRISSKLLSVARPSERPP